MELEITAYNTAIHMQSIGYNKPGVSCLRALQQCQGNFIARELAHLMLLFGVLLHNKLNINVFEKFCYAVIALIAFHAYLTTNLLLFYANFQRFISNGW